MTPLQTARKQAKTYAALNRGHVAKLREEEHKSYMLSCELSEVRRQLEETKASERRYMRQAYTFEEIAKVLKELCTAGMVHLTPNG